MLPASPNSAWIRAGVELTVVPCGPWTYLVEPDGFIEFCNQYNEQGGLAAAWWLTKGPRDYDGPWPIPYLPEIPAEYQPYLKIPPLVGRIASIEWVERIAPLELFGEELPGYALRIGLDIGRDAGVLPGLRFRLQEDYTFTIIEFDVDALTATSCTGETHWWAEFADSIGLANRGVQIGSIMTTGPPALEPPPASPPHHP